MSGAPHALQKRAPSGFSVPHCGQLLTGRRVRPAGPGENLVFPGHPMYFVSDWGEVSGPAGLCLPFDRVKVTVPGNRVPVELTSSGCLDPVRVHVGPVTKAPPP